MLLLECSVENFGVFAGKHRFDLRPSLGEDGSQRPLIVMIGQNGSGKTTLFQALLSALYGAGGLQGSLSTHALLSRMHRPRSGPAAEQSAVSLSFHSVHSGHLVEIQVERRWRTRHGTVEEHLSILRDGQPLEIDPAEYPVWLHEFLSPGYGHLCFFDGEQFDALIDPRHQSKTLEGILSRLLGLDLIQRLDGDLRQLLTRQGSAEKTSSLYKRVLELHAEADSLHWQLSQLEQELQNLQTALADHEAALKEQEHLLAAEGGKYAAQRSALQQHQSEITRQMELHAGALRELCAELLPFALAPELCLELSRRLNREVEIQREQIAGALWAERIAMLEQALAGPEIWEGLELSAAGRQRLIERLKAWLASSKQDRQATPPALLHHLADPDQKKLRQWIHTVLLVIPKEVQAHSNQLRTLRRQLQRVEQDLGRAPDDAALKPIYQRMAELQHAISEHRKRADRVGEQIGSLRFQLEEKIRALKSAISQYERSQKVEKQQILAERSRMVLSTYRDALTRQKLRELETKLVQSFAQLCQKADLLTQVLIDPETFAVQFRDVHGRLLSLESLSAGERQLYALALLQALRAVGQRRLPLVMDTPLARLDEAHRQRFLREYLPGISDQVVLFTTDTEMDATLLSQVRPYSARIYRFSYESERGATSVSCEEGGDAPPLPERREVPGRAY